ncbi:MAG: DUF4129 domain-containing protein [Anaerolineae bacterium]|jgi:hypothetical protein|nr:DUF4129 domain-containing protein [Anaerolineae bacterium]
MSLSNRHEEQRQRSKRSLQKTQPQAMAITTVIISLMMMLVAFGFTEVARTFDWPVSAGALLPFVFFTALEILYAREIEKIILTKHHRRRFFRVAEIILLAVLLRVALLLFGRPAARWPAFLDSAANPVAAWFVPEYSLSLFVLFLIWIFLLLAYQDVSLLFNLDEFSEWHQVDRQHSDLTLKRAEFLNRFVFLGLFVLVGMIFSNGDWQLEGGIRYTFKGESLSLIAAVMAYFLLLLVLMSQTQLARLRTRWWLNHSAIHPKVQRNWLASSLVLFTVTGLIALLSPTAFADRVFATLHSILLNLMMALQLLVSVLLLPLSLLIGLLFPLQAQAEAEAQPVQPPADFTGLRESLVTTPPAWLETLSTVTVWVLLGGVIVFALAQYLRQEHNLAADIRAFLQRVRAFLMEAWQSVWGGVQDLTAAMLIRRRHADQALVDIPDEKPVEEEEPELSLPRREIFRLYRRVLAYGRSIGRGRKPSQTPKQYEQILAGEVEDHVAAPLHHITDAFQYARYSLREITQQDSEQMAEEMGKLRIGKSDNNS